MKERFFKIKKPCLGYRRGDRVKLDCEDSQVRFYRRRGFLIYCSDQGDLLTNSVEDESSEVITSTPKKRGRKKKNEMA